MNKAVTLQKVFVKLDIVISSTNMNFELTHALHHFLYLGVIKSLVNFFWGQIFHGILDGSWWHVFHHVLHISEVSHKARH